MFFRGRLHSARPRPAARLLLVACLASCPALALGQEWLHDRRNTEGPGIQLSDSLVFHPGIAIEGGYDTNVFYAASDDAIGAGRLRITPQVSLATLPPQRIENPDGTTSTTNPAVDFRLLVAAIYNQYLSADEVRGDDVMAQSDVGIQTTLDLVVYPRRTWSFLLSDTFTRTIDPGNDAAPSNFNRDYNDAELGVRWAPGGGTFEADLLAGFAFNLYEEGGTISRVGDYLSPRGSLKGRWRFFPNTALTFETIFSPILKDNGPSPVGDLAISTSYPVRTWLGLNGQWTSVIATQLRIGYGVSFYDLGEDFESVLAQAEIDFILGPQGRLKAGFIRDFVDSYFSNFYVRNEAYVGWDQMFAGVFLIGAKLAFGYLQFATLYTADGTRVGGAQVTQNPREDFRITGTVFGEYRMKDWLGFNLTLTYEQNITDFQLLNPIDPSWNRAEEYWKLIALGGARVIW